MNDLYIFSSASAVGSARMWTWECGIKDNVDFAYLDYDMAQYGVPKDLSDDEVNRCHDIAYYCHLGEGSLKKLRKIDFSLYDKIVVWHDFSSQSLLVLYFICEITNKDIYHINVKEQPELICSQSKYIGEIAPEVMVEHEFYKRIVKVSDSERELFHRIWLEIQGTDLQPKIADGYNIICKTKEFVKDLLLKNINEEISVYKAIHKTITTEYKKEYCFDDFYLYYMLIELVEEGKLSISCPEDRGMPYRVYYPEEKFINGIDVSGNYSFKVRRIEP